MNIKLKSKRCLAGILATISLSTTLTGCGGTSILTEDVTKYNLPAALTVNEVNEYYKQSMAFDSVVTRNIEVHEQNYEMHPVDQNSDGYESIRHMTSLAMSLLNETEYPYSEENARALTEDGFHYMKAWLNDKQLTNPQITSMSEALGFYFVDITATVGPSKVGEFTGASSLLGINGAFKRNVVTGEDSIDEDYIRSAIKTMNEYFVSKRIEKMATYNPATHRLSTDVDITNDTSVDFTDTTAADQTGSGDTIPNNDTPLTNGEPNEDAETTEDTEGSTEDSETNDYGDGSDFTTNSTIKDTDKDMLDIHSPGIDISQWHEVIGSSTERTAYMPRLDLVYKIPEADNTGDDFCISGPGIFPAGIGGLKTFQWDRDSMNGTACIRIVFKEDVQRPGEYINTNIYPKSLDITTGISFNGDNSMAKFLIERFNQLVERADRSLVNCDMTALMNGKIFADMGMAVLRGYENDHVNLVRQISTVRRIVKRDIQSNTYLLEVETLRQEGAKGYNTVGTYLDTAYVAVQQRGLEFVITDWLTYSRVMQREPDIDPDSAVLKRLVALDIAGDVPEKAKNCVGQLLNDLYSASTYRVLSVNEGNAYEVKTADGNIYLMRGMIDCFNSNPEMLSSSDNTSINSGIRSKLIKYGTNVSAQMRGQVYEWVGGTSKQVEFMTEELITYTGRSDGIYMQCYYLVSNLEDKWVIDDIQIIDEQVVEGTELQTLAERIPNITTYSSVDELKKSRLDAEVIVVDEPNETESKSDGTENVGDAED